MNEQDLFEIMDGLPAHQIAEAAEWKYRHSTESDNEIDSILIHGTMPEKITYRQTEPEDRGISAEQAVTAAAVSRPQQQSRVIRSATAGLAAVAAAFALIFGGIALKLHRDNAEIEASMPGTVVTEGSTEVTQVTGTDLAALTKPPTGYEMFTTSVPAAEAFAPSTETVPHHADTSLSAGEENFLGGHGLLRVISPNEFLSVMQDDDYIYLGGSRRILKENLSPKSCDSELVCQKPGCEHNSEDCPLYYSRNHDLICSGQDIYIKDWDTMSPKQGFTGGLKRILSDGSTEDVFPLKEAENAEVIGDAAYLNVLRLGDTGIYFLEMYYRPFEHDGTYITTDPNTSYIETVLLDSRTGNTLPFDYLNEDRNRDLLKLQFDEASGHLFVSYGVMQRASEVLEIDIYTGNQLGRYAVPQTRLYDWVFAEGRLHYLADDEAKDGTITWYCTDPEKDTTEIVMKDCKLKTLFFRAGRMYAIRHARVGMDALVSYTADGTDEQVLTETEDFLDAFAAVNDPERIVVSTNSNTVYMTDPEKGLVRLEFRMDA